MILGFDQFIIVRDYSDRKEFLNHMRALLEKDFSGVSIFSKGEKANLSQAERNELTQILGSLAET